MIPPDLLRFVGALGLAALCLTAGLGCKDHHQAEAERAGTPAPNQRSATPSGTYR